MVSVTIPGTGIDMVTYFHRFFYIGIALSGSNTYPGQIACNFGDGDHPP